MSDNRDTHSRDRRDPPCVHCRDPVIGGSRAARSDTGAAFLLHPTDWAGVELELASQSAVEHIGRPYDPATRRLFGVPVAVSNAQTAGVGHGSQGAVALDTDNRGIEVQWSENATADSFGKNQVVARCESRYATSVYSPLGVVKLDLTP
jgi:hypothetical protein